MTECRSSGCEPLPMSKIQEPKASGSEQWGPPTTAVPSEGQTWCLGPENEIGVALRTSTMECQHQSGRQVKWLGPLP